MLCFRVYFYQLIEIINQVISKIKSEYNLDTILAVLAALYFIIIAAHYFRYQNKVDASIQIEQSFNSKLESLQEDNNIQALNENVENTTSKKDIVNTNRKFISLLEQIYRNSSNHKDLLYKKILKKNNTVFVVLQNFGIDSSNIQNSFNGLRKVYKNISFDILKLKELGSTLQIYLQIKLL